ncbi:glycosyltransferase family 2 protein [Aquimarina pacifica]|uniref:glycosyltransferase family 2 protein n=1 Tax=Aquimarina pacifica TaxID=1296415 RepID=UPI000471140B|nr:glycosyltransferase family A protein [Aquimarina pacifica]
MNKLVYCFWPKAIKQQWEKTEKKRSFEDTLQQSMLNLSLSALNAKKNNFKIEIITDLACTQHFEKLNVGDVFSDLELVNSGEHLWIEAKMLALAKQNEPFVYIDWNIHLKEGEITNIIKNYTEDVLVASEYNIVRDGFIDPNSHKVQFPFLKVFSWIVDMTGINIDEFVQNNEYAFDCRILGFNNLELRDTYVNNFYQCLTATRASNWYVDSSLIIEEYLLFCITKSTKSNVRKLFGELETKMIQVGSMDHQVSTISGEEIQETYVEIIRNDFPEYDFLIPKKWEIKNKVKISLCTVVMNRKEHLLETVKCNLEVARKFDGAVDLNIIDYNSQDGLQEILYDQDWFVKGIEDGLIHYFRNYDAQFYHRTLPKNAIHFLAKGEYLFNADADNYMTESYLTYCLSQIEKRPNQYFRCSIVSHVGAYGRVGVHRDDFREIGGYNLKMENYGFEDIEITVRLRKIGVEQHLVPSHLCLNVIDHEDEMRIENEKQKTEENVGKFVIDSDHDNRKDPIVVNPNKDLNPHLELFKFNSKNQKTLIEDDTYPYISRELVG